MENKETNFANRTAQIKKLYSGEETVTGLFNKTSYSKRPISREHYYRILSDLGTTANKKNASVLSEQIYATHRQYANVIDYLSNMFLWRYYYMPIKKKDGNLTYGEIYDIMTDVMDGMNIKITYPNILAKLFIEGSVFLYNVKDETSKTVSTLTLPPEFCTPIMVSQFGTGIYKFKLSYFDSLNLRKESLADFLLLFPEEIVEAYLKYKNGGPKEVQIDGRFGTFIQVNETGTPPFLGMIGSLLDYQDYKINELEKNAAELDSILVSRIPIHEDRPIFEVPEAESLHTAMSRALAGNERLRLLTTFGEVELIPLQSKSSVQNDTIRKAHEAVYYDSGLNTSLFNNDGQEGIDASLRRDESFVWKYIEQLTNFYNLSINNLFSYKGYQLDFSIIPITHYNNEKMMELFRRNSEFGVGRLELIVASGTRQEHIYAKSEVENLLKLDEILIPLQSSHTRSGKEEEEEKEKVKPEEKTKENERDEEKNEK